LQRFDRDHSGGLNAAERAAALAAMRQQPVAPPATTNAPAPK